MSKKKTSELTKLALKGIISGAALSFGASFAAPEPSQPQMTPLTAYVYGETYTEIHGCAGHNVCKGLGGCKVTEAKLAKLAKKRGISVEEAGEPHACAGHNECKGLGGCKVDAKMLATLKSKIADPAYAEVHGCAGHNTCKGLGGCKVDAATLKVLAEKAGIPLSEAGEPHGCAGKNECKGLGGCSVDAAKLKKLKAKH